MTGLSSGMAIAIIIFVTFLWGSWFQTVKHTGDYPVYAFISWMYLFSIFIVWGAIGLLQNQMVPVGVLQEIADDPARAVVVLFCGMAYAVGMQLQLEVVKRIGLILSTSISATCTILMGTVISAAFGGLPQDVSFLTILFSAFLLILATVVCQKAGVMRDQDTGAAGVQKGKTVEKYDLVLLLLVSLVLAPFYSLATAIGLRSPLRLKGFSSLTMMGVLVIGAFLGTSIYTAICLTREKKWHAFLRADKGMKVILPMAFVAALCHFGGNVLHAVAAPVVSVAIATPLGFSFSMWSYVWGLIYGEFKGAKRKTYGTLICGIAFFLAGILTLSFAST